MRILVVVETLTGNTASFGKYVMDNAPGGSSLYFLNPKDILKQGIEDYAKEFDKVIIGCYTWDSGRIPTSTKRFVIQEREKLMKLDSSSLLVFGSGWSIYENFCGAVDGISTILDNKYPTIKFELRFDPKVEVEAVETFNKFMEETFNDKQIQN